MNDTVLVVENDAASPVGVLAGVLDAAGIAWKQLAPHAGDPLPSSPEWRAIVSLGGVMGAYEEDRFPFLVDEKRLLAKAVADDVPVLGICLGSQILADALGGRAYRAATTEVGYHQLGLTEEGRRDPVVGAVVGPHFVWHRDTFSLPPRAELLAASADYPHAYRIGSALAVQFHPEVTGESILGWAESAGATRLAEDGVEMSRLVSEVAEHGAAAETAGLDFFHGWMEAVRLI